MKIGILTFTNTENNYGQYLQAFALQRTLQKRGHKPFFVDIDIKKFFIEKSPIRFRYRLFKLFIKKLASSFSKKENFKKRADFFLEFKKNKFCIESKCFETLKDLKANPPTADCFIVGSDQVWNFNYSPYHDLFFCSFVNKNIKKHSYAASFGHEKLPSNVFSEYRKLIKSFSKISVREETALRICSDLGVSNSTLVPDPTLLISGEEWKEIADIKNKTLEKQDQKKIFIYTVGNDYKKEHESHLLSLKKNNLLRVTHVSSGVDESGDTFPSINEWLNLINESDLIITNSYHGMVFSILFEKKFFILLRNNKHEGSMNDRIFTLLKKLDLTHTCIASINTQFKDVFSYTLDYQINWESVKKRLEDFQKIGFDFISTIEKDT